MHEDFIGVDPPHAVHLDRNIPGWMPEQIVLGSESLVVGVGLAIAGAMVVACAGPGHSLNSART